MWKKRDELLSRKMSWKLREVGRKLDDNREMDGLQAVLRIRFALTRIRIRIIPFTLMRIRIIFSIWCRSGYYHSPDPDHIFNLMQIRILPLTFFPIWTLSMLQNGPLRLPPCHFDSDTNPAFHFDADTDPAFHFDADLDPHPASQNDGYPDPQQAQERWLAK